MENQIKRILEICQQRREMGADKYGDEAWKGRNMFEEARQEHYDIINYNLFQILKINALEEKWIEINALSEAFIKKDEGDIDLNEECL